MTRARRPGEGSIRKRKNGTYEGRYTAPDGRQKSVYRKTEDEVRRELTKRLAATDDGVDLAPSKMTVEQYLEEWMSTHIVGVRRPTTQRLYRSVLDTHLIPILGFVRLENLRDSHIRDLHRAMFAKGLAPATVKSAHSILSAALTAYVKGDPRRRVNVAQLIERPTTPPRTFHGDPIHLPTEDEILAILDRLRETADDLEPLYRLTIATGIRQGEALGLRWADLGGLAFHLTGERPTLTIRRTIDPQTGEPGPTKSAAGNRTIRVSEPLMTILADHYRRMDAQGRRVSGDDYVFPGVSDGVAIKADALRSHLYGVQAATGVARFRWHDFRHYVVTKRLAKGDNPSAVSRSVGHSRLSTTTEMYDQSTALDLEPLDELDRVPTPILRKVQG